MDHRSKDGSDETFASLRSEVELRIQAEKDALARETRLQAILDTTVDAIVTIDEWGAILSFNKAAEKMFGYSQHEAVGANVSILMDEPERSDHDGILDRYRSSGVAKIIGTGREVIGRHQTGRTFPLDLAVSESWGPDERVFTGILRDLTEPHRLLAAFRNRERHYRRLFESAPIGIAVLGDDETVVEVNPTLASMLGRAAEDLAGHELKEFAAPEEEPPNTGWLADQRAGVRSEYQFTRTMVKSDHSRIVTRQTATTVRDEQGGFLYSIRMVEDITERQRVERSKSEFLAMTSHELRTPLTAIYAALGLIDSGAVGVLPDTVKELVSIASANSERLVKLVGDIVDLEGMNLGKIELSRERCNSLEVVHEVIALLQPFADEAEVGLITDVESLDFKADRGRVLQVLTNLVGNAIKYAPSKSEVTVTGVFVGGTAEFSVSDSGGGIPSDQMKLIFDSFQQVDATDSRAHGGSGLGLAIAKAIVELHGGAIWVESTVGAGSTFSFSLPVGA